MKQGMPKISFINTPLKPDHVQGKIGLCPHCGQEGVFSYTGEQHVPLRLALGKGLKTVISLWTCEKCQTTLSAGRLWES